jgi:glycerate kinase
MEKELIFAVMKVLFAPDSFKGSMSSAHVTELLRQVTRQHFPDCEMLSVPVGDGGEGTAEALVGALGGRYAYDTVTGPMRQPVRARYGVLPDATAVIEMAQASGLPLVPEAQLNPLAASSVGTGQLLRRVLEQGCRKVLVMIGGSATNDGGMGAASALGIRFLDGAGREVTPSGRALAEVEDVDTSAMLPQLGTAQLIILCDVRNPLLGPQGATFVYGRQKGADLQMEAQLEAGMAHYADVIERRCGRPLRALPGAGAAGGFVLPLLAFAGAEIRPGIEVVLSLIGFDRLLDGVDLVVTGEGRLDSQSLQGKVLAGIGEACRQRNIPVAAIVGCMGEGAPQIFDRGISSAISCVNSVMSEPEAMRRAEELFLQAADQMYRFIEIGMGLQREQKGGQEAP